MKISFPNCSNISCMLSMLMQRLAKPMELSSNLGKDINVEFHLYGATACYSRKKCAASPSNRLRSKVIHTRREP